jgi:hypothetical protein
MKVRSSRCISSAPTAILWPICDVKGDVIAFETTTIALDEGHAYVEMPALATILKATCSRGPAGPTQQLVFRRARDADQCMTHRIPGSLVGFVFSKR